MPRRTRTTTSIQVKTLIVSGLMIMVGVLLLSNLFLSAHIANDGVIVSQLEHEISFIHQQNKQLEEQLHEQAALYELAQQAEKRGFVTKAVENQIGVSLVQRNN